MTLEELLELTRGHEVPEDLLEIAENHVSRADEGILSVWPEARVGAILGYDSDVLCLIAEVLRLRSELALVRSDPVG